MNNNWIELHNNGKGILIAINRITAIEEYQDQHSFIYLKYGQELEADESYTDIVSKLGMNQLNK